MALRAVIFSLAGVLLKDRDTDPNTGLWGPESGELRAGVIRLFSFLRESGIVPIVMCNRMRRVITGESEEPLTEWLTRTVGQHKLYVADRHDMPWRPKPEAVGTVLEKEGLTPREA